MAVELDTTLGTAVPANATTQSTVDEVALLRVMLLSRGFDKRAALHYRQGGAWFHISGAGHEALAVLASALREDDVIAPHYRDRALLLARGMPLNHMLHDLLATAGGDAEGRNMTSHFSDRSRNVFSVASPVAGNCLPAAGFAWAAQLSGQDSVVLCLIGDAATRQGEFYEAVAFAVEKALPVIFVVEDNLYGISSRTESTTPYKLGLLGERVVSVDGADTRALGRVATEAITRVRQGGGPALLWCRMDRLDSHTSADDQRIYRDPAELAALSDPIALLANRLLDEDVIDVQGLGDLRREVTAVLEGLFATVKDLPRPDPSRVGDHLYASSALSLEPTRGEVDDQHGGTIVDAVNQALAEALVDPRTIVFGEDVEDPKGGVFGLTKGLTATGRVFNSPLAEATIVGIGVGLAAAGMRPIVELQFVDFAAPAWNQISSQLATLRWRTNGGWQCPLLVYAPYGAYLPGGGIWHSQSNESLFTHVPGLRVAVPSSRTDTRAVFEQAMRGQDPVIALLPKHLLRQRYLPYQSVHGGPLRQGNDATVVAWGNCVELALQAADSLARDGVSVEVLGLCWLDPCDTDGIHESVRRTGRLVVVQEDVETSSFGSSLVARVLAAPATFFQLLAPPLLVSRAHVHVPYDVGLEAAVLPSAQAIVDGVRSLLR